MRTTNPAQFDDLDLAVQVAAYLPEEIRRGIERQYYMAINEKARLSCLLSDPEFLKDPAKHVGLYSDHGVVHARDVAKQIIHVLDIANGVLIPGRSSNRLRFMKGYGVIMAYIHDIGMRQFSYFGRKMHPEFASQEVFCSRFDGWVDIIWNENCGNIAWRLTNLANLGVIPQDPKVVLREMLAMANCHNKSKVPVEILNDVQALRQVMLLCLGTNLDWLFRKQRAERARQRLREAMQAQKGPETILRLQEAVRAAEKELDRCGTAAANPNLVARQYYTDFGLDFERDAYQWLVSDQEPVRSLVSDVIDTLRALRCADALRQRGTVLKTSGQYEIFVDRTTANPIYALRADDGRAYLLELDNVVGGVEANMASSELTPEGDLRFAFHRGAFPDPETVARAAHNAAVLVCDVQMDVIQSFYRPLAAGGQLIGYTKPAREMKILLEGVDDNLEFADLVCREIERINPSLAGYIRTVPSLRSVSAYERARYLRAEEVDWDMAARQELLQNMRRMGCKTDHIDPMQAFLDVKCTQLQAGEVLIEAGTGTPAGFVYVPLGEGLKGTPLGGYDTFTVWAWVPLGNTGVIRGEDRNATVVAERDVRVLVIPKETYFRYWHYTYSQTEFLQLFSEEEPDHDAAITARGQ